MFQFGPRQHNKKLLAITLIQVHILGHNRVVEAIKQFLKDLDIQSDLMWLPKGILN